MNMKRVGRRGLSPVIASVLMILLVMVLASIVFLWARGFIDEQVEKFGKPIERSCDAVDFDISRRGNELEIVNKGNINIKRFDIMMELEGNSELTRFSFDVPAGGSAGGHVTLKMSDDDREPEKIIAYPVLVGKIKDAKTNNAFTCLDAGRSIL